VHQSYELCVNQDIHSQYISAASLGILAIPSSPTIYSSPIRKFLALVTLQKNNRHELDFLLHSFARYTIITTISYCYDSTNRTNGKKEREPLFPSIAVPISVPLFFSQCSMNFLGGFEMPHCLYDLSTNNLSLHF
jgi:hypothetical protein